MATHGGPPAWPPPHGTAASRRMALLLAGTGALAVLAAGPAVASLVQFPADKLNNNYFLARAALIVAITALLLLLYRQFSCCCTAIILTAVPLLHLMLCRNVSTRPLSKLRQPLPSPRSAPVHPPPRCMRG